MTNNLIQNKIHKHQQIPLTPKSGSLFVASRRQCEDEEVERLFRSL